MALAIGPFVGIAHCLLLQTVEQLRTFLQAVFWSVLDILGFLGLGPGPGPVSIMAEHMGIEDKQWAIDRQKQGHNKGLIARAI